MQPLYLMLLPTYYAKYYASIIDSSFLCIANTPFSRDINFFLSVPPICKHLYRLIIGPPELLFEQNQTVMLNVSEQVVLNCTVSSSPDPVYNWSIPGNCLSCPHINNDSVMIFTADITDSGEYGCKAKNKYGSVQMTFRVTISSMCMICMHDKL